MLRLSSDEKEELIKHGVISTISAIPTYSEFDTYRHFIPSPMQTNVPALDMEIKSPPSLQPNFNYLGYIDVSKRRMKDALHFILARSTRFARNVLDAIAVYFKPAGQYFFIAHKWKALSVFQAIYKMYDEKAILPHVIQVFIASCYVLAFVYGAYIFCQGIRKGSIDSPASSAIGFLWITLVYAAVVTNLTDIWENNRIRFMTDPFVWIIVGLFVSEKVKYYCSKPMTSDTPSSRTRMQTVSSKQIIRTVCYSGNFGNRLRASSRGLKTTDFVHIEAPLIFLRDFAGMGGGHAMQKMRWSGCLVYSLHKEVSSMWHTLSGDFSATTPIHPYRKRHTPSPQINGSSGQTSVGRIL